MKKTFRKQQTFSKNWFKIGFCMNKMFWLVKKIWEIKFNSLHSNQRSVKSPRNLLNDLEVEILILNQMKVLLCYQNKRIQLLKVFRKDFFRRLRRLKNGSNNKKKRKINKCMTNVLLNQTSKISRTASPNPGMEPLNKNLQQRYHKNP